MTRFKDRTLRRFLSFLLLALCAAFPSLAADLPTAAGSPIAGIAFDDRPLILPVQRNFQMALLTASSELGRSCGRMEAYGWRLGVEEQDRVNQIFDNTVDRMRAQGFLVEGKTAQTVSRDVTLFAADRADKHLVFMWSAGEIGLVMVLCETSAPLSPIPVQSFGEGRGEGAPLPEMAPAALAQSSSRGGAVSEEVRAATKADFANFSPVGAWVGDYTCAQGTLGATLAISSMKGDQFSGYFSFYPTPKNPYAPRGRYKVFGEYDRDTMRILVNPGDWIQRPKGYENTIMIGSFDPARASFSAFFQGVMGCTSFEAKRDVSIPVRGEEKKAAKAKAKKASPKKKTQTKAKPKTVKSEDKAKDSKASEETVKEVVPPASEAVPPKPRDSAIEPPAEGIVLQP